MDYYPDGNMKNAFLSLIVVSLLIICLSSCTKQSSGDGVIPQGSSLNKPGTGGIQGSISPKVSCTVEAILISTKVSLGSVQTDVNGAFFLKSLNPNAYNLKISPVSAADMQQYGVHNWLQQLAVSAGANISTGVIPLN